MALKDQVIRDLRNDITLGKLIPGEHITEKSICLRFGVTRTPARDALKQLEKEGLVAIYPNIGARVADFSPKSISDLYDILSFLDGTAARLACSQVNEQEITKLKECQFMIEKAARERNIDLLFVLNKQFHMLIIEFTTNNYLIEVAKNLNALASRLALFVTYIPHFLKAVVEEHPRIVEAIISKNSGLAEYLAREHMETAKKIAMKNFQNLQKGRRDGQIIRYSMTSNIENRRERKL